ncbi:MAG: sensor histidine kinase [Calditerrivibrio sp.]|uniref:sensor histidine kinase n=1 Tax=Calditerrivibrio sp. TaxID=2792612 RepID=UPI003D12488C
MKKMNNRSDVAVKYLLISKDGNALMEIGEKSAGIEKQIKIDGYDIETIVGFPNIEKKEQIVDGIAKIIELLKNGKKIFNDDVLIEYVDMIINEKSIDEILYFTLKHIISSNLAEKTAFFILNDKLLKLRGVAYLKRDKEDIIFENRAIKSCQIDLSNRGKIADAMFFDKVVTVNYSELPGKNIERYFDKNTIIIPVYNIKGVVGVVLLEDDGTKAKDDASLRLVSRLVSLGINYSSITKQLKLSKEDVAYFKESIEVSSTLTHMGKITASVAHEIKNPLVSIGGFAKRLERYVSDERGLSYLKIIQSETTRLEQIVNDILTYSKIFNIKREKVSLYSLLMDLEEFFKDELMIKRIMVKINCPEDLIAYIDPRKFKQIFVNLIKNSIQSIENDGEITIDVERVKNGINIIIRDTGDGFPIEIIQRPFEPFVTTKEAGTGLGLSICHKIVSAHQGQIWLDNYDDGAMVKIFIPSEGEV